MAYLVRDGAVRAQQIFMTINGSMKATMMVALVL
jgi:hypothetical protein